MFFKTIIRHWSNRIETALGVRSLFVFLGRIFHDFQNFLNPIKNFQTYIAQKLFSVTRYRCRRVFYEKMVINCFFQGFSGFLAMRRIPSPRIASNESADANSLRPSDSSTESYRHFWDVPVWRLDNICTFPLLRRSKVRTRRKRPLLLWVNWSFFAARRNNSRNSLSGVTLAPID